MNFEKKSLFIGIAAVFSVAVLILVIFSLTSKQPLLSQKNKSLDEQIQDIKNSSSSSSRAKAKEHNVKTLYQQQSQSITSLDSFSNHWSNKKPQEHHSLYKYKETGAGISWMDIQKSKFKKY